ncbi:MAG: type-F conjugative transfer system protein TraW [Burkholderiales bacterium]|nr:type-F conjugative transfer system protein TraW [Burkholderiales bacterium]
MKIIVIGLISLFLINNVIAENLGVVGKTYPVIEPDMIEVIKAKAKSMMDNGQWDKIKQKTIADAKNQIENPQPVFGITHTREAKTIYYNPVFKVDKDITDANGKVIAHAGYYNPLTFKPFPEEFIFIDGSDEKQVDWAVKRFNSNNKKTKIILTSGSYISLDKKFRIWFYYDQNGRYTQKLGIKHVPAIVNQEGKQLRVDELLIDGDI